MLMQIYDIFQEKGISTYIKLLGKTLICIFAVWNKHDFEKIFNLQYLRILLSCKIGCPASPACKPKFYIMESMWRQLLQVVRPHQFLESAEDILICL